MGRTNESTDFLECVLEGRKKVLGEYHVNTLGTLEELAALFQTNGRVSEAVHLQKTLWEARKVMLGESHPAMLLSKNVLVDMGFEPDFQSKVAPESSLDLSEKFPRSSSDRSSTSLTTRKPPQESDNDNEVSFWWKLVDKYP